MKSLYYLNKFLWKYRKLLIIGGIFIAIANLFALYPAEFVRKGEKDFKENPIGHEAKLRRAKIAYYQGDFQWAQAQLGALKASTSKLIANDAMDLSLLITDNYNLDTTEIAMKTFANADLLAYQQKYTQAII